MASIAQIKADTAKLVKTGKSAGGGLSFPSSIQSGKYYTHITFTQYERATPSEKPKNTITDTIILPLPMQIEEAYNVSYNQVQMGASMVGLNAGQSLMKTWEQNKNSEAFAAALQQQVNSWMQNKDNIYDVGVTVVETAAFFSQSVKGAVQLSAGSIQNPHTTAILDSVPLRTHQLTWTLTPSSAQESAAIRQIADRMRWNCLPEATQSGLRMTFPNEVTIKYMGSDKFPIIQKSVVTAIMLNHTPSGTPTFFADGSPTQYVLMLGLQEVNQITRASFPDTAPSTGTTSSVTGLDVKKLPQLPNFRGLGSIGF